MSNGKGWATTAFLLGIAVSVAANVAHTWYPPAEVLATAGQTAEQWRPKLGAQAMAAFYPLALLLTVEILARVPWPHSLGWSAARYGGAAMVAGVAAIVSYRHMAGLLAAYGEDQLTAAIAPLAVDGLMIVASVALLAIGRAQPTEVRPTVADLNPTVTGLELAPHVVAQRPPVPVSGNGQVHLPDPVPALERRAAEVFADDLARGHLPGIRAIKQQMRIGQPKAAEVRAYLRTITEN